MIGQILLFLLLIGITVPFCPPSLIAQEDVNTAPVNPNFLNYLDNREALLLGYPADEYGLGLVPSPLDSSHLGGLSISEGPHVLGFPVTYDLRTQGKLTPVRNQGSCGSCWSFATYGSLESNLLPLETWNFSEDNLINTHGFDLGNCAGGNSDMSTAYLARWDGPVSEADDPYDFTSPPDVIERKHLQEVLIIPDRAGSLDNDAIKQAVMAYGALYTTMYWSSAFYQSGNHAYYYSGTNSSNHAVGIVGWDDNYDKNRFVTPPSGNGAWIIRNSWGAWWGESGYFYISYYDSNIGKGNVVFHLVEPVSNYSRIYQYDPLGWTSSVGYGVTTAWFANTFIATANEKLKAVSFYTASLNSTYELHIYTNITSDPTSGAHAGSKSGTIPSPGYHTISLDSPVSLASGQIFSVVIKLTTPGYNWPVPIERPWSGYSSQAIANAGESYISSDGNSWSDMTSVGGCSECNVCLKAFTSNEVPADIPIVGDWNGDGTTTIGVYRPSNSTFYLRDANSIGGPDVQVPYGISGDIPLAGDWDGNGTTTIGIYRPSNSKFYLRDSNNKGNASVVPFQFGVSGDIPIAGDWDGNGTTTIGIYRPSNSKFYLRNSNSTGNASVVPFQFGAPGDIPIVGDWDGMGYDSIGVYRPSNQNFYLKNSNTPGFADWVVQYGVSGNIPVVGDWNGRP